MTYQNHLIDPTFFYDAIEEFSFDYNIYIVIKEELDAHGLIKYTYSKQIIRGSLQSDGATLSQSKEGAMIERTNKFYCKSLYRINIGDVIEYKNNYYRVNFVQDYDEFGVRNADLVMIKLTQYKDLAEYIKYLQGQELV